MTHPDVYALLRERMADDNDIPDTDEIIAAALDAAVEAVKALPVAITVVNDTAFLNKQGMRWCLNPDDFPHGLVQVAAIAAIEALRGESGG